MSRSDVVTRMPARIRDLVHEIACLSTRDLDRLGRALYRAERRLATPGDWAAIRLIGNGEEWRRVMRAYEVATGHPPVLRGGGA